MEEESKVAGQRRGRFGWRGWDLKEMAREGRNCERKPKMSGELNNNQTLQLHSSSNF